MLKNVAKLFINELMNITTLLSLLKFGFKKSSMPRIILCNTPTHGNIGDQAITLAELQFLKKNFKQIKLIEITEDEWKYQKNRILKRIHKNDVIVIHGGGYIGTLWRDECNTAIEIITLLPENNKIIFPQSTYYGDWNVLEHDKNIFSSVQKLWFCARDESTFNFVIDKLKINKRNVFLVSDIVTTFDWNKKKIKYKKRNEVLLVLRKDVEKTREEIFEERLEILLQNKKYRYKKLDMFQPYYINVFRKHIVLNRFTKFAKAKFVITDRLHGMYFSAITNTNCFAIDNVSGKVCGGYKWLANLGGVKYFESEDDLLEYSKNIEERYISYDYKFLDKNFDGVVKLMVNLLNVEGK